MRGAFVVQFTNTGPAAAGPMEGSVEEVDTGKQLHFHSQDELMTFLRERLAETGRRRAGREGVK
jgi:hypothetical protein